FAATQLPKNSVSTKQIKKNAVVGSKVKDGSLTGADINASTLGTVPSATNASHASTADNANNASQLGGIAAAHYITPGSTLASGDSETGVFTAAAPSGEFGMITINFTPKLSAAPANFENVGASTSAHCPGPRKAEPGYLCIYEAWNYHMAFEGTLDPYSSGTSLSPEGVVLFYRSNLTEGNVRGSWAYKAP
ncbi:MAG TPA: hypothetical protein VFP23_02930, partial [Solirubrobacterales bacterium]|nr:hypothetical protein [Solirubrobacterales bacterium]